jgi:hypothetical protein
VKKEITYDSRIKDNDLRMPNRMLQVTGFEGDYVFASVRPGQTKRLTKIRRDRIHCDGKPRRSGWSLVEPT